LHGGLDRVFFFFGEAQWG